MIYFLVKKVGGEISKDNCDEDEKEYISMPEWIDLNRISQIKFVNSIDDAAVIGRALELLGKRGNRKDELR